MRNSQQKCLIRFTTCLVLFATLSASPYRESAQAKPIKILSSFPADELVEKGVFLNGALYFDRDLRGDFFISNTKEGNILRFDAGGKFLTTLGHKGQGPGELSYVANIIATDDFIIVQDIGNHKIQLFGKDGKPGDSFRIFKTYKNMVFEKTRGLIYAAPILNNPDDRLVEVLNLRGERIRSFGAPMEFKRKWSTLNDLNLAFTNDGELLIAFAFFPVIRKYAQNGDLLAEKRVIFDGLKDKENRNLSNYKNSLNGQTNPSFYFVINAMRTYGERIFLMSIYPAKTILELDSTLSVKSIYLDREESDYFSRDFIVCDAKSGPVFYVLQIFPDNIIDIFGQK